MQSPNSSDLPVVVRANVGDGCAAPGGCGGCAGDGDATPTEHSSLLESPEHVLSTLDKDGSRRWIRPSLSTGRHWKRRRIVAYALVAFFVALPHLRIGGKPVVLLDITARQFTILGHTFLPTDTPLLALGMVGVFLSIVLMTALSGRVWCGWGCPQTVYMEFLFRPIDRFFEGTVGRGGTPKRKLSPLMHVARFAVYTFFSMLLAHTFLAYFVGTNQLRQWIQSSPIDHPLAFLVMFGTTAAMLFDFLFFREQLCLIACPYGRFQSVMLDRRSLIVGYDYGRGEPRGKVSKKPDPTQTPKGDCVACNRCVAVCPTGIDIRNGLQMECINCTQCIDACDEVMRKVGRPEGLIRYTSQDELEKKPSGLLRARTILYPILLAAVGAAFLAVLSTKYSFDARLLRAGGIPYTRGPAGELRNSLRVRIVNRSNDTQLYTITAPVPEGLTIDVVDPSGLTLEPGATSVVPVMITLPSRLTAISGHVDATLQIDDQAGNSKSLDYRLLGPKN